MSRILYIWKGDYPWEVRIEKFCNSLVENGNEVIILCRWVPGRLETESIGQIKIIRVGFNQAPSLSIPVSTNPFWISSIKKIIKQFQPGLIIAREIMLAEAAARLARKHYIPVIMDMAEHYPAVMKGWKKYKERSFYKILVHDLKLPETFEKRSVNLMDGIITVCSEQSERLINEYNYPAVALQVVHNTPDINSFENVRKGCSSPPRTFAYHGNVNNERNMVRFVKGFIIAAKQDPDISLEIAGVGEDSEDIRNLIESSDVQNQFRLFGSYKHEDLVEL